MKRTPSTAYICELEGRTLSTTYICEGLHPWRIYNGRALEGLHPRRIYLNLKGRIYVTLKEGLHPRRREVSLHCEYM